MITKKNRTLFFLVDLFLAALFLVECYFFYLYAWRRTDGGLSLSAYWAIHNLSILLFILGFQLERIIDIITNRKRIYLRCETLILSAVFVFLAYVKLWIGYVGLPDLSKTDSIFFVMRQSISFSYFRDYLLMAAAGILLVKAFTPKEDPLSTTL